MYKWWIFSSVFCSWKKRPGWKPAFRSECMFVIGLASCQSCSGPAPNTPSPPLVLKSAGMFLLTFIWCLYNFALTQLKDTVHVEVVPWHSLLITVVVGNFWGRSFLHMCAQMCILKCLSFLVMPHNAFILWTEYKEIVTRYCFEAIVCHLYKNHWNPSVCVCAVKKFGTHVFATWPFIL